MSLSPVIPVANKIPGTFIEVYFGVGPSSAGDAPRKVMLTGNATGDGTATDEIVYQVLSEDEARTYFGAGSELHRMFKKLFGAYPSAQAYGCAIADAAGTAATGTLAFSGTATAAGSVEVECVDGEKITVQVAVDDAAAAVATAVEAAIDGQTDWPITAATVTATVTATAKNTGPRGNAIPLRCTSLAAGISVTPPATGYLTNGATDDDPANALDAIAPERYHYIVAPYTDSTNLADYSAHCNTYAGAENGRRQVWIASGIGTLAATTTIATALNASRGQFGWLEDGDTIPSEMAAAWAGYRCFKEGIKISYNYDGDVVPGIVAQDDVADYPTGTSQQSALNNGITPFISQADGTVRVLRSITSRSQDASGNPSYNVLDSSKAVVPDYVADNIAAIFGGEEYRNRNIDRGDSEGNPLTEDGITAQMAEDAIFDLLKETEEDGHIENVDVHRSSLKVQIADSPDGRFLATVPVDVVEGFHQLSVGIRQIG